MKIWAKFIAVCLLVTGCASTTPGQKGALAGSAVGAGLGAIIGHQAGRRTAEGAVLGAAVGGLGGALLGEGMATKFCPTCGRSYFSDQTHCALDGTPLQMKGAPAQTTQQQQAQANLPKFCPQCGRDYSESANYCLADKTELKLKQK